MAFDFKYGGTTGSVNRNPKRTAGWGSGGTVDEHGGVRGNGNTKAFGGNDAPQTKVVKSTKGTFFKKGKGLEYKGVNQYGGSGNNENPFQVN